MTDFAALAETLSRSTVEVKAVGGGSGSGVVWRSGLVITNAHVARGARARVRLWDRRELDADVVARDRGRDLVALDVPADGVTPVTPRDPGSLRVGELVVAVGHPFGVRGALAMGIVQALGPRDAPPHRRWIRADVRLAPGNSGGPLADTSGRVVGVNTMVSHGLAFAIPATAIDRFVRDGGRRSYVGVATRPVVTSVGAARLPGLMVVEVLARSPAGDAGLQIGDVLLRVGDTPLDAPDALASVVHGATPGDTLAVDLARGGRRLTREVTVRET